MTDFFHHHTVSMGRKLEDRAKLYQLTFNSRRIYKNKWKITNSVRFLRNTHIKDKPLSTLILWYYSSTQRNKTIFVSAPHLNQHNLHNYKKHPLPYNHNQQSRFVKKKIKKLNCFKGDSSSVGEKEIWPESYMRHIPDGKWKMKFNKS